MSPDIRVANLLLAGFVGALLFALPNLSPRGMLFGVPIPQGFRQSADARHAITRFRLTFGSVWLIVLLGLGTLPAEMIRPAAMGIWIVGMITLAMVARYSQYRALRGHAVVLAHSAEMEISSKPDRLPVRLWLNAIPVLMLAGAALYTYANWGSVPTQYPVWWSANGNPQRWVEKTPTAVFGPLGYAVLQVALLTVLQILMWFGSRRNQMRVLAGKMLLAFGFFIAGLPTYVALRALSGPSQAASMAGLLIPILPIAVIVWFTWRAYKLDPEPTPNECWHGGMIYYNPNDAALFVQRRDSIGITLNFANRWGWLVTGLWLLLAVTRRMIIHS